MTTAQALRSKYLTASPTDTHLEYTGEDNNALDREIEMWEVKQAMQRLNGKSAPGLDHISNKAIKNLDDASVGKITKFFNQCWESGRIPRQWKAARISLIPKPGKPAHIENLRPISLTSCLGKTLEHV